MPQQNANIAFIAKNPAGVFVPLNTDGSGGLISATEIAADATPIAGSSGNVANAAAVATLAASATKKTYITGFTLTASGATSASVVSATVAGLAGGTLTYTFVFPAGATVQATTLNVQFAQPAVSTAINTAIVVTLPAGGSGNTNAAASATGFQL
jgi:hypothetical protein